MRTNTLLLTIAAAAIARSATANPVHREIVDALGSEVEVSAQSTRNGTTPCSLWFCRRHGLPSEEADLACCCRQLLMDALFVINR
jgi:hypothetical protein